MCKIRLESYFNLFSGVGGDENQHGNAREASGHADSVRRAAGDVRSKGSSTVKLSKLFADFLSLNFQVEEYEELKLDLVDLRSISQIQKTQINELTQKLNDIQPT